MSAETTRHTLGMARWPTTPRATGSGPIPIDNALVTDSLGTETYRERDAAGKGEVDQVDASINDASLQRVVIARN